MNRNIREIAQINARAQQIAGTTRPLDLDLKALANVVIGIVCAEFGLERRHILSKNRSWCYVLPRHIAIQVIYMYCKSQCRIAAIFKRHHGTIFFALRNFPDRLDTEPEIKRQFEAVCAKVAEKLRWYQYVITRRRRSNEYITKYDYRNANNRA